MSEGVWHSLRVENDFGGDETGNFGPRMETGSSLYQVVTTVSVAPSVEPSQYNTSSNPSVRSCCVDDSVFVAVEKELLLFQEAGNKYVDSIMMDSPIEVIACDAQGSYLVVGDADGVLHLVDVLTQAIVVRKQLVPNVEPGSEVFQSLQFLSTPLGDTELIIVLRSGRVFRFPQVQIALEAENEDALKVMWPQLTVQVLDTSQQHSELTVAAVSLPMLGPHVLLTAGEGDSILCLWDLEQSKSQPIQSQPSFLANSVGVKKCEVCPDTLLCFILDDNDELSLWNIDSFTRLQQWARERVLDFMILETGEPPVRSENVRLAVLSDQDGGKKTLSICELPSMQHTYSIVLESFTHLVPSLTDQEAIFFVEGVHNDSLDNQLISELRLRSLTESDPQVRFHRLLTKKQFDEASRLAEMFHLDIELVYSVKATCLLNQLAPWAVEELPAENIDAIFTDLLDCLQHTKDDVHVCNCCVKAYLPTFSQNLQLLNYAEDRLSKAPGGETANKDVDRGALLTLVLEAKHRLATYEVVFDINNFTGADWQRFHRASMKEEFMSWLRAADLDKAFGIWNRHQSDFESGLSISVIDDVLHVIPESATSDMISPWLADSFIPFVIRTIPEALPQVARWLEQRARSMEIQEKLGWPQNGLSLCELLLSTCSSYSSSVSGVNTPKEYATQMCSLSLSTGHVAATKSKDGSEQNTDAFVQLHTLITQLRGLLDLHTRYGCKLRLEEYVQETTESLTYRILDHVVAVELVADTIHDVVRPFMNEHYLNEERTLYQYIGDLISGCKSDAIMYGTEALWEAKAIAVIGCIREPQYKCRAIVEAMQRAYIPWSPDMKALVEEGLQLNVPGVKVLEEQVPLIELRHLLISYGFQQFDVSAAGDAAQLLRRIVHQGRESALADALCLVAAYKNLQPHDAYFTWMLHLIKADREVEVIQLLQSLDKQEEELRCCRELVSYVTGWLSHRGAWQPWGASDILLTRAACRLLKYSAEREQDPFALEEIESQHCRLLNILALQTYFGHFVKYTDYSCANFRHALLKKVLAEYYCGKKGQPIVPGMEETERKTSAQVWNEAAVFRFAELLLVPRDSLKGKQAIAAAETGNVTMAITLARELYELRRSHETGEVLYKVARCLLNYQTQHGFSSKHPNLSADMCQLASQATAICHPDLLQECVELSRQASLAHNVLRQCESGDYGTAVMGTSGVSASGASRDPFQEWTFTDTYQEDGLVMDSAKTAPMLYRYATHRLDRQSSNSKTIAPARKPSDSDKDENKNPTANASAAIPTFAAAGNDLIQYLRENSHCQLALHYSLDMLAGMLLCRARDDRGCGSDDQASQGHQPKLEVGQLVQMGKSVLTELTRTLLKKVLSQSIVEHSLAVGYLTMLHTPDALTLMERVIKSAGTKYKKVLQLSRIGKRYSELCEKPKIVQRFEEVETDADWGKRLSKHKICFKEVYSKPTAKSKMISQLVRCDTMDVDTIKDFCSTFKLDDMAAILSHLEHLLVSPPGGQSIDVLLQRAEAAAKMVTNPDILAEHLVQMLDKMEPYDYEQLLFIYNQICKGAVSRGMEKARVLVMYLQSYKRVAPPSDYERNFQPISEEEQLLQGHNRLSPLSKDRLPFHPFIKGDPWKIISPELNAENVSVWVPIAASLGLSLDQLYLTTIQNIILAYTAKRSPSPQTSSSSAPANPQDKSGCNWREEEEGENTRLLVTMQNLILKVSDSELAMACSNWAIKTLPMGTEKVLALRSAVVLAEKWMKACPDDSAAKQQAMETYKKFSDFWRRLSTEQVLYQHQLGEAELVALSGSPAKLIFKLYEHPSIARRADTQGSLLDALPDIHSVANKVAAINKVNVDKVRTSLINKWLPSTLTNKLEDGDTTMNMTMEMNMLETTVRSEEEIQEDEVNLRRVIYILQINVDRSMVFLLNFAYSKESHHITNMCRVRALRCLFALVDHKAVENLANKSLAEFKEYMQTLLYLVEMDRLHIPQTESSFTQCKKDGLVRGIWRNHSHEKRAVRLVANLCLDYAIYDVQLWNSILMQLKAFDMSDQLCHVLVRLSGISSLWQVDCIQRMWRTVLLQPLVSAVCPLAEEELNGCFRSMALLHSCPLLLDLELQPFIQHLLRLELRGLAVGVTLLLPDDKERESNLRLLLGGGTGSSKHVETLNQLAEWVEDGHSVPLYKQALSSIHDYISAEKLDASLLDTPHLQDYTTRLLSLGTPGQMVLTYCKTDRLEDAVKLVLQFKATNADFAQAAEENNLTEQDLLMAYLCHEGLFEEAEEYLPHIEEEEEEEDTKDREEQGPLEWSGERIQ